MKNITIKEFLKVKEIDHLSYDMVLKLLKPNNNFNGLSINEKTIKYSEVKYLFKLASKNKYKEIILYFYNVKEATFLDSGIFEYYAVKNYIDSFIVRIAKKESQALKGDNNDAILWEQAGGNRLKIFNDILPIMELAETYSLYPFDIMEKPYNEVFTLLVANKIKKEVLNKFNDLKYKK